MIRVIALLAATALLTGCAHTLRKTTAEAGVGSASYRSAPESGLAHYQLALGQVAMGATLQAHVAPAYPDTMLAACPSLTLCKTV